MNTENDNQLNVETDIDNESNVSVEQQDKAEKLFTQDEVDKMITKRLAKEKAKQEKALKEAERLSKLSEEERVKAELEADRMAFEEERAAFLKEKMLTACEKELLKESLPVEFAGLLVADDADTTSGNIKAFKDKWNKSLEAAVNERLKANARVPKKETHESNEITWEEVIENPKLLKKYNEQRNKK
jgi:hypothetical protein